MSKYTTAQITVSKNHEKKHLFLKDQNSDIFLILNNRIYPLHRNIINRCSQFSQRLKPGQRVYFIDNEFNSQIFQKVLASLYGYQLIFSRNIQVVKILDVAKFFGLQELQEAVYQDINVNFEQYGPILLFKISRSFSLSWLYKRCLETFVSLKFQQFFINKFDLMNSDQPTFQQILKNHQILKSKKVVEGIQHESIIKIIQQYSQINSTKVDIQQVLSISAQDEQQTEKMLRSIGYDHQIKNDRVRKRKSTWNCPASRLNDSVDGQEKKNKKQKKEEKNIRYQQLKEVNLQIQNRISSTSEEIKETKTQMQKCSFQSKQINELGLLVKDMQKTFDQQSKKLNILKQKTLEFSGRKERKKSPENEKYSNY